jgi:hypothetical protein
MATGELFGNLLSSLGSTLSSSGFLPSPGSPSSPEQPPSFSSTAQPSDSFPRKTAIDVVEEYFQTPAGQGLSDEAKAKARETALSSTLTAFGANNEKQTNREDFANILKWHAQSINDARKFQAQSYFDQLPFGREALARKTDASIMTSMFNRPVITPPLVSLSNNIAPLSWARNA